MAPEGEVAGLLSSGSLRPLNEMTETKLSTQFVNDPLPAGYRVSTDGPDIPPCVHVCHGAGGEVSEFTPSLNMGQSTQWNILSPKKG